MTHQTNGGHSARHSGQHSGRLGQGGIGSATAFVARALAGLNLWQRMALSMLMLRCFMQLLVSGFQVSNFVSGRAPCCQDGEAQLCSKEKRDSAAQ